jgi:hypothetical protein
MKSCRRPTTVNRAENPYVPMGVSAEFDRAAMLADGAREDAV